MRQIFQTLIFSLVTCIGLADTSVTVQFHFLNRGKNTTYARVYVPAESGSGDDYVFMVPPGGTNQTLTDYYRPNDSGQLTLRARIQDAMSSSLVGNSYIASGDDTGALIVQPVGDYVYTGLTGSSYTKLVTWDATYLHSVNDETQKTLWVVDDTTLTANLFREGIDKVVQSNAEVEGSSSGGMTLDQFSTTNTEAVAALQKYSYDHPKTAPAIDTSEELATAQAAISDSLGARELPDLGTVPTGSGSLLAIEIPHVGTIDFDPSHHARIAPVAAWIKGAIAWFFVYLFQMWLWKYFREIYSTLATSTPAKGNPVVGGTGAQATSLIVAIGITGAIASFPVIFWAAADSGLSWASAITSNPFDSTSGSDVLETGMYLANIFFPVGTALASATAFLIIQKAGILLLAATQTVIRFFIA